MKYEGIVYRPPSEACSLIFQVTIGCAHNRCTFCTMYKDKKFRIKSRDEISADISDALQKNSGHTGRIFLADGDAMVIKTEDLIFILDSMRSAFPNARRISSYAAPKDVLTKSDDELKRIREAGLEMAYMGLESGDDEILKRINKGASVDEIVEAGLRLKKAGIRTSITLISGLGGKERFYEHAEKSAAAISRMKPDYLGFLTLLLESGALMLEDVRTGKFELLNPQDVIEEMEIFLKNVDSDGTVFRANHASNYVLLKGKLNEDIPGMLAQIDEVKSSGNFRSEIWRSL